MNLFIILFLVTEEDLNALCAGLKMNFSTYVSETVKALTRQNMGSLCFDYQVKHQADGVVDFVWKKEIKDKDIKLMKCLNTFNPTPDYSAAGMTCRCGRPRRIVWLLLEHTPKPSKDFIDK